MKNKHYKELLELKLETLIEMAYRAKRSHRQDSLSLCTIMNIKSGGCSEDCSFCAQSARYKTGAPVYPMAPVDEILKMAEEARKSGASRFSLVASGKGPAKHEIEELAKVIERIKKETGISVCASLGIVKGRELAVLKEAGLTRYHHNLETSRSFFPRIVTTHTYEARLETIFEAKRAGLEVCAGGIIGLGESQEQRLELALELRDADVDSVPLNFLIPIEGTPLYGMSPAVTPIDAIRTIAIFRLVLPDAAIRLAAGRETLLRDFLALAFYAGADGMMIGGYLTRRGRPVEEDQSFCKEIKKIWS